MYARHDDTNRGLSPVVGVVLLVAITVLLAATTASFLLGIGESTATEATPTIAFDQEYSPGSSDELAVTVTGGDTVDRSAVQAVVAGASCSAGSPNNRYTMRALGMRESEVTAGARAEVAPRTVCATASADLDLSAAEVRVVWVGADGRRSQTLSTWEGPDA